MPLEVLATAALPNGQFRVQSLAFSWDGDALLAGILSHEAFDDQLRVASIPWAGGRPVTSVGLPHEAIGRTDGSVRPVDHGLVVTGNARNEELWRLAPRLERLGTACFARIGQGQVVQLAAPSTIRWPGHALSIDPTSPVRAVALAADRSHVAFAEDDRVVCVGLDGRVRCSWAGTATRLAFATDDLGLWGLTHDALTWFPWQAAPAPFTVPGLRPWDFDAATRRALFANGSELVELDLGTGGTRAHGAFRTGGLPDACDPARRRVARYDADDRFRVFQLT